MYYELHITLHSVFFVPRLHDRRSLVWGVPSALERAAANKYQERGWAVHDYLDISLMTGRPLELGSVTRHIGDSMCWTFQLDSGEPWSITGRLCPWSITYSKIQVGQAGQGLYPSLLELGVFTLNHTDEFSYL